MKIKWIKLQNVKSYLDETIAFNEGVNFISGVNGAGKTTIIESIGYALFNSKPGNIGEFIRYGHKTGVITIELEANDGLNYRVVRKFGNTNSWLVFDLETNSEVDLHGSADIVPFLKEILGIDPDQDPAQLYDDVIGISQGTFTSPFLESAAGRRDKFNRIFKVDSYRAAFMKILSVIRRIDDTVRDLEIKKAEKEGSIKDYLEIKTKTDELTPFITKLQNEVIEKKQQKDSMQRERDMLRNKEKEIQKNKSEIQLKEEKIRSISDAISKLREDLKNARISEVLVCKTTEGYQIYNNLKKEQELLEKQRKERDNLKDQLSKNETAYEGINSAINTESKAIILEEEDINIKKTEVSRILEASKTDIIKTKEKLDNIVYVKSQNDMLQSALGSLEITKNDMSKVNVKLRANYDKWVELHKNKVRIEDMLLKEVELISGVERLKLLEQEKKSTMQNMAIQQQILKNLTENLEKTSDGRCPFLDAPCRNIEGGLDNYFTEQINNQIKMITGIKKHESELDKNILAHESARGELLLLNNEKENLNNLNQQEVKYSLAYKREFHILSDFPITQRVESMMLVAMQLHDVITKYIMKNAVNNSTDNLNIDQESDFVHKMKLLKEEAASLKNTADIYNIMEAEADKPGLIKVLELLEYSENVYEKAERVLNVGKQLQNVYSIIIDKEHQSKLSEAVKAGRDTANAQKNMDDLQVRAQKLDLRLLKLKEDGIRLSDISLKKLDISNQLMAFEGLDIKTTQTQNALLANQEAYDTYMKHQTEAKKVERISTEIVLKQQNVSEEKTILAKLNEAQIQLSKEFSEKILQDYEKLTEKLNTELTIAQSNLTERQRELKDFLVKLEIMEKLKKEILVIIDEINRYNNIKNTTVFIRNILNKAGERISAVYREYLSSEANAIYRDVSKENVKLEWREDYEVFLVDMINERKRERCFRQLSGGEQMTAALAMRLGL